MPNYQFFKIIFNFNQILQFLLKIYIVKEDNNYFYE